MTELSQAILRLRSEGKTYNEIAAELGCSKATISYHCGVDGKAKVFARQRDQRNKTVRYIQEHKQKSGCADCGEKYPYYMLDLDHVRGKKIANVSAMVPTHSIEAIKEEIAKCDVVCANCHRVRTFNRSLTSGNSVVDISEDYI